MVLESWSLPDGSPGDRREGDINGGSVGHTVREATCSTVPGFMYASHQLLVPTTKRTDVEVAVTERQVRLLSVFSPAFESMDVSIRILGCHHWRSTSSGTRIIRPLRPSAAAGQATRSPPRINLEPPTHETREEKGKQSDARRDLLVGK